MAYVPVSVGKQMSISSRRGKHDRLLTDGPKFDPPAPTLHPARQNPCSMPCGMERWKSKKWRWKACAAGMMATRLHFQQHGVPSQVRGRTWYLRSAPGSQAHQLPAGRSQVTESAAVSTVLLPPKSVSTSPSTDALVGRLVGPAAKFPSRLFSAN